MVDDGQPGDHCVGGSAGAQPLRTMESTPNLHERGTMRIRNGTATAPSATISTSGLRRGAGVEAARQVGRFRASPPLVRREDDGRTAVANRPTSPPHARRLRDTSSARFIRNLFRESSAAAFFAARGPGMPGPLRQGLDEQPSQNGCPTGGAATFTAFWPTAPGCARRRAASGAHLALARAQQHEVVPPRPGNDLLGVQRHPSCTVTPTAAPG